MLDDMNMCSDHSGAWRGHDDDDDDDDDDDWPQWCPPWSQQLGLHNCSPYTGTRPDGEQFDSGELNAMILDVVSFQIDQIVTPEYRAHRGLFRDTGCPPNAKNWTTIWCKHWLKPHIWNQIDISYPPTSAMITQSSALPSSMFGSQMLAKSDTWEFGWWWRWWWWW